MHLVIVRLDGQQILQSPQHSSLEAAAKWRHELADRLCAEGWIHNLYARMTWIPNSRVSVVDRYDNGERTITLQVTKKEVIACTPNEAVARIAMHLASAP